MKREKIGAFEKPKSSASTLTLRLDNWKLVADQFYRASEYLFIEMEKDFTQTVNGQQTSYRPQVDHPYLLMVSLSIENLLKGLVLFNNPNLLTAVIDNSIKTHNLQVVAKLSNLVFTQDEEDFFQMGTTVIQWFGRYPLPVKAANMIRSAHFDYNRIRGTYLQLFTRLSDEMKNSGGLTHPYDYTFTTDSDRHIINPK